MDTVGPNRARPIIIRNRDQSAAMMSWVEDEEI